MQGPLTLPVHALDFGSTNMDSTDSRSTDSRSSSVYPSHEDTALLLERYLAGARSEAESFVNDDYLNRVIDKPWGHECRVYADDLYDFWELVIAPDRRTSTHCHPHKATTLLVLSGLAHVKLLTHTRVLGAGEHLHLHPSAFHSTENIGPSPLHLIELETPRNKLDLVRANDLYGRAGQGYEKRSRSRTIAPILEIADMPGSSLRPTGSTEEYRYSVCASAAELDRQRARIAYAIPLGPGAAGIGTFDILTRADDVHATPDALPFFLIALNPQPQWRST